MPGKKKNGKETTICTMAVHDSKLHSRNQWRAESTNYSLQERIQNQMGN